jgi:uncharacterized protein
VERLALFALVGLVAQLVDGALGMGYGATSATLLLSTGIAPASVASTVLLAQVGTTAASGLAHWRFGNVDWRLVRVIALPGAVGGVVGAIVLTRAPIDAATPVVAGVLFALGISVLVRFAFGLVRSRAAHSDRHLRSLGAVAGFFNATGGGWGPIATPSLLARGAMAPRLAVGSVSAAEFVVVVATTGAYLVLVRDQYQLALAGALLVGGVVAAPFAAWLVRFLHPRLLGTLVGGVILVTNTRTLLGVLNPSPFVVALWWLGVLAVVATGLVVAGRAVRSGRVVNAAGGRSTASGLSGGGLPEGGLPGDGLSGGGLSGGTVRPAAASEPGP